MSSDATDKRRDALDALLAQPDFEGRRWNDLLRAHGPILPEEIDHLAAKATAAARSVRRNAARLLGLVHGGHADAALRTLVERSGDHDVIVLALAPLLDAPDGAALAARRTREIRQALGDGGTLGGLALRAAWKAGLPDVAEQLRKKLAEDSRSGRDAATAILAQAGPGPLEAEVRAIVLDRERRQKYALADLYQSLTHSDDPSTADVLRRSLAGAPSMIETDFSNAVFLGGSRKPWLRALLLDMASHEGSMKWSAFGRLADWGPDAPMRELVQICADAYAAQIGQPGAFFEPCRSLLGTLAGKSFSPGDPAAARDFAVSWLAGH